MQKPKKVTTKELSVLMSDSSTVLVDLRSPDAYNGWNLMGEKRGGHIPGARNLPLKWAKYMDWIEIVRSKGFQKDHRIILYSYSIGACYDVASLFQKAGYKNLLVYDDLLKDWLNNPKAQVDRLKRYKNLVPAEWVKKIVDGKKPAELENRETVIIHAHYRNRDAYLSGHIPGAIDMDTLTLESPETWNRRSPEELKKSLEDHGISSETTVIVYGKFMWPDNEDEFPGSAAGHIGAIRNAMIMMYTGVKDVRVLNGGYQSWIDNGYPVSREDVVKEPVVEFGEKIPARPEIIVDIEQAKEMIASDNADIICVRSYPEYIGEVSGYNYIEKTGRIPGAIFGDCGSDAYHMENYRNADHTIREYGEVEKIWKQNGITPDKHLAFYCGTGWRGSEAFYNAWLMGWPKVSVFDGGWFEWSNDPSNPVESGAVQ